MFSKVPAVGLTILFRPPPANPRALTLIEQPHLIGRVTSRQLERLLH